MYRRAILASLNNRGRDLRDKQPMIPSPGLIELWDNIQPILLHTLHRAGSNIRIVSGYFADEVYILQNAIRKPPFGPYIFFNIYLLQFAVDFFYLEKTNFDQNSFSTIVNRYWRDMCDNNCENRKEWWRYFQFNFESNRKKMMDLPGNNHILLSAFYAMLFITIHELTHSDNSLFSSIYELVNGDTFREVYCGQNIGLDEMEEIPCDYVALHTCMGESISKILNNEVTKLQIFQDLIVAQNIIPIFNYMRTFCPLRASIDGILVDDFDDEALFNMLEIRTKSIVTMAKISQNSGVLAFSDVPIQQGMYNFESTIMKFSNCLHRELSLQNIKLKEYNQLRECDKPLFRTQIVDDANVWLQYK